MLPEIVAVIIGGLITLYITNLTNTNQLKKEFELELLQKIKLLLNDWINDLSKNTINNVELKSIDNFSISPKSDTLSKLITYFNLNSSVLKNFSEDFKSIHLLVLKLNRNQKKYIEKMTKVQEKKGIDANNFKVEDFESLEIMEEYATEVSEIIDKINLLIASIDKYISEKILEI